MGKLAEIKSREQDRIFDLFRGPEGLYLSVKIHDNSRKCKSRVLIITITDFLYQLWQNMTSSEKQELSMEVHRLESRDKKSA